MSSEARNRRIRDAYANIEDARQELWSVVESEFKPTGIARWSRGGHSQIGIIREVSGDRLKVENGRTGKLLWIHAYDIEGCGS